MKFKIKHEKTGIQIVTLISLIIFFLICIFSSVLEIPLWCIIIDLTVMIVSAVLYFIEQIVGTVITIEDRVITIKHLLETKKITIDEICNLNIEPYERRRKQEKSSFYIEYRMRMTISIINAKDIVLTDTATTVKGIIGFILSRHDRLSNEEVSLYKAYQSIKSKMN